LVAQHKDKLNLSGFSKPQSTAINIDARIVFEWNETAIDFELQFVNPQKKFFTWSHTKLENGLRLHKEKTQGFNAEEFLLVDVAKGEWIINIENKQSTHQKPIALKFTVYKNYGKSIESKETKVLILNNLKEKQLVGKIVI